MALLFMCLPPAGQAAGEQASPKKHFLWRAEGGKSTVYLLGTVHVAKPDLYPLPAVIEDAFTTSDILAVEVDASKLDWKDIPKDLLRLAVYPEDESVANHLTEKTRDRLAEFARGGQLPTGFRRFKPWVLILIVSQTHLTRAGYQSSLGIDNHFIEKAEKARKRVESLETTEAQLHLLQSLPGKLQDQLLFATLMQAPRSAEVLERIFAAWRTGDTGPIEDVAMQPVRQFPTLAPFMTRLIDERNDEMTKKIDLMLQGKRTYFVAVGAAHLVGPRGIVAQLKSRNYRVDQM